MLSAIVLGPALVSQEASAAAITLYDNLNDAAWRSSQGSQLLGQSFTTSTDPVAITAVSVRVRNATENNGSSQASTYSLEIWSSSGGRPAARLATVVSGVSLGAWADETKVHTLATPVEVAANSTYFVVMKGSAGGTTGWKCTTTAVATDVTPTPTFTPVISTDNGSNWSTVSGTCGGNVFGMKVTGGTLIQSTLTGFTGITATYGDTPVTITAPTANTAGSFTYASSDTSVATVSGNQVNVVAAGTATLTATFTPTDTTTYSTATTTASITVNKATPTLTGFTGITATYGDTPVTITAPSSGGVAGSFTYTSSDTSVATTSGNQLSIVGAGTATLTASFTPTDSANYDPTSIITTAVTVGRATPTLTGFGGITATYGDAPVTITPPTPSTAGSFTYASSDTSVVTVTGTRLTAVGAGTATLTATFTPTDTANYVGTTVTTAVTVGTATPALTGFVDVSITLGDDPVTITPPTADVDGRFTYASSDVDIVSVSGDRLTAAAVGTATLTATFTPTDTANYVGATINAAVDVAAAPVTPTTTTTTTAPPPDTVAPDTVAPVPTEAPDTAVPVPDTVAPSATEPPVDDTTPPTTTPPPVDQSLPPGSTPKPASDNIFGDDEATQLVMRMNVSVGDPVDSGTVIVEAVDLEPGADVTVLVYSEPRVLLTSAADDSGAFRATVSLPADLEPGGHSLVAESMVDGRVRQVAGAFSLNDDGTVSDLVQPAAITDFAGPDDTRLTRALEMNRPVYDVESRPLTTSSIVVAAAGLIALAGGAGIAAREFASIGNRLPSSGGGDEKRQRNARGKLANAVTKKLKGINVQAEARGDSSRTWRWPGTEMTDRLSSTGPNRVGPWSAVAPRVFVDGAWLRAIFGSLGFLPWFAGIVLGVTAGLVDTRSALTPTFGMLLAIVVLGILDAGAGGTAWAAMVITAAVSGDITGWPDVRTALGLGILLATVPLLAHVIRPLRRHVAQNSFERWERVFDYVIMPVFVAFAAGSMLKALNGLSGLEIITPDQIGSLRRTVFVSIMVRLAAEDVAAHLYPQRMLKVQPAKLVSPDKKVTTASIVMRSLIFLLVAEPFFGVTAISVGAAVLLAIPNVLKMWEDDLPNSAWLNKWLPRGLFRFLCTLIIGAFLTATLIAGNDDPERIKSTFIWMLLPGVIIGVVELFARFGGDWKNVTLKRSLGVIVWLSAAGIVTGQIVLFS